MTEDVGVFYLSVLRDDGLVGVVSVLYLITSVSTGPDDYTAAQSGVMHTPNTHTQALLITATTTEPSIQFWGGFQVATIYYQQ